jgi:MFS family permease
MLRRILVLLWFSLALNYLDRQAVFSIFPALQHDLGLTRASFGAAGTIFIWVYSLSMPITGRLADVVSRPLLIITSVALWSCATLGTATSHSTAQFLFWRGVMGITEALYIPAALGLIGAVFPVNFRSRALAIHATAQFAGILIGSSWGGWSADNIGWRAGFSIASIAGFGWAVVLALFLRGVPDPIRNLRKAFGGTIISGSFLVFSTAFFCLTLMLWVLYAWLPLSLVERFHITMTRSGFVAAACLQGSAVAGVLIGGFIGDALQNRTRMGRVWTGAAGLLISAPCFFLIFNLQRIQLVEFASVAFGLFSGLLISNIFAMVFDIVDERRHSSAAAILNAIGGLAGGVGILVTGAVTHRLDILNAIVSSLSAAVALTMIVGLMGGRLRATQT